MVGWQATSVDSSSGTSAEVIWDPHGSSLARAIWEEVTMTV